MSCSGYHTTEGDNLPAQYLSSDEVLGATTKVDNTSETYLISLFLTDDATLRTQAYKTGTDITLISGDESMPISFSSIDDYSKVSCGYLSPGIIHVDAGHYPNVMHILGMDGKDSIIYDIEEAVFPEEYKALLREQKEKTDAKSIEKQFDLLYEGWRAYLNSVSYHSNPDFFKTDKSYEDLVSFCAEEDNWERACLLTIEKSFEDGIYSFILLDDIIPAKLDYLKERAYFRYSKGDSTIPSTTGNFYRLAQEYIDYLRFR